MENAEMMARWTTNANCKLADVSSGITNDRSTASTLNMPLSGEGKDSKMVK